MTIADVIDRANGTPLPSQPEDKIRKTLLATSYNSRSAHISIRVSLRKPENTHAQCLKLWSRTYFLLWVDPRGMGSLEPTSPRSVEACLRLGIEPFELHFMPPDVFAEEFGDKELAQIAYNHHERVRQVGHYTKAQ